MAIVRDEKGLGYLDPHIPTMDYDSRPVNVWIAIVKGIVGIYKKGGGGYGGNNPPISAPKIISVSLSNTAPLVGESIIASALIISNPAPTVSYQWQADGVDIVGATNKTFVVTSAQVGKQIRVQVTVTNGILPDAVATSNYTILVPPQQSAPVNTVLPSVLALQIRIGDTITEDWIDQGTWTGYPTPILTSQLKKNGVDVSMPYLVVAGDIGLTFTVVVTATNVVSAVNATSAASPAVTAAPSAPSNNTLPFIIDDTPLVGDVINNAGINQGTWNGNPVPTLSNQLKRNGTNVTMPYTVGLADTGLTFTVAVTATNTSGSATVESISTQPVPIPLSAPTVTSVVIDNTTPAAGQVISVSANITGTPSPTVTYQWKKEGVNISGATNQTYTVASGDIGSTLSVTVTATNSQGSVNATSASTSAVSGIAPSISNVAIDDTTPVYGETITATPTVTGSPTPTVSYQWRRNGTNISGATSASYAVVSADIGTQLSVVVTATNSAGTDTSTKGITNIVQGVAADITAVTLSDTTPNVGDVLSLTVTVTGTPTPSLSYQWRANGANIIGATGSTYTVTTNEISKTISCMVTASNSAGSDSMACAESTAVPSLATGVTYVTSATGTDSATVSGSLVDDFYIVYAFRDGGTAITVPAGYTNVRSGNTAAAAHVLAWKKITANNEAVPTFTNATTVIVLCYRGLDSTTPIGANIGAGDTTGSIYWEPLVPMTKTDGTSKVILFGGTRQTDLTLEQTITGFTRRATVVDATNEAVAHESTTTLSSFPTEIVISSGTVNSDYTTMTVELLAATGSSPPPTGESFASTRTTTLTTTSNGQIIEYIDFDVASGAGIVVNHTDVIIRKCRIKHRTSWGIVGWTHRGTVEDCEIINATPPTGINPETSENIGAIAIDSGSDWTIRRVKCRDSSVGFYLRNSPNALIEYVEAYNMRGPFPRGQLCQFNEGSNNCVLRYFYVLNELTNSYTEDTINVRQSTGCQILNGLIDGNNSPSGQCLLFEDNSSGGIATDVDATHGGNGSFSAQTGSTNVTFTRCRAFDNYNDNRTGRGAPSSGATFYQAYGGTTNLRFLQCSYSRPANAGNWAWFEAGSTPTVQDIVRNDALQPMAKPVNLTFFWS